MIYDVHLWIAGSCRQMGQTSELKQFLSQSFCLSFLHLTLEGVLLHQLEFSLLRGKLLFCYPDESQIQSFLPHKLHKDVRNVTGLIGQVQTYLAPA